MVNRELFPLNSEKTESIDLKKMLFKYLRYWYVFTIGTLLCLGIAFLYLRYYTVPLYRVNSTILIKDDNDGTGSAAAAAFSDLSMFKSSKNIDNEIEVLNSKSLMQRVVRELSLHSRYYVKERFKNREIYGSSLPFHVITAAPDSIEYGKSFSVYLKGNNRFELNDFTGKLSSHHFGEKISKAYGHFSIVPNINYPLIDNAEPQEIIVHWQDPMNVAAGYNQAISIEPVKKNANVLRVSIVDPIPERGRDIVNKLIEVYDKEAIEDKNVIAATTLNFIDERLEYITNELSDVEKDVEEYKRQNELTDVNTQASNYLAQASNYKTQLSEWAIQIDILESIERYLKRNDSEYRMVPSTLGIQDATLQGLISQYNGLQMERERMLRTLHPNNPLVENINEQLVILKVNILENLHNIKEGLIITSNNLKANSGEFQSRIKKVPSMERELLEINRQQAIKQNLYLYLLQKREETAMSLVATVSNSRIIDPATARAAQVAPNKSTIYLMALLLGLGLPFAGLYLKDLIDDKVQNQKEVKSITTVPILGELSHNPSKEVLVVTKGNSSPLAEMFRLIRAKLQFAAIDKENKVILVTSSMSGEGKTFFTINLGASLSLTGKKVVLLELDLRKPGIRNALGLTNNVGITDYLISDKLALTDIIRPSKNLSNLFIVGSGAFSLNPAELMMSPKLAVLINRLKESFDHIIIDTAPIGQVADAFSLSPLVDSTIYLVRYNFTYKKQLEIIESIFQNKELRHPMIVLNDAKMGDAYGYGYAYGYGNSNGRTSKKESLAKN